MYSQSTAIDGCARHPARAGMRTARRIELTLKPILTLILKPN